jgi:ATP-dependent exoDNAse (exonuclease V) beta subunit
VDATAYAGFDEILIGKKKEVEDYSQRAAQLYHEEREKLELDAINMLYVALTRAEKGLYIITEQYLDAKGNPKTEQFSGLFINYMTAKGLWVKDKAEYSFGSLPQKSGKTGGADGNIPIPMGYTQKDRPEFQVITNSGMMWDTQRLEAIGRGNLIHGLMAEIYTAEDLVPVLGLMVRNGAIAAEDALSLGDLAGKIINHPELAEFYHSGNTIKNEAEILTAEGRVIRPDRIVIRGSRASILDYKTGIRKAQYQEQLHEYARAVESMGLEIEHRIIVYINEEVNTEFI